jgi:hypothetical protein
MRGVPLLPLAVPTSVKTRILLSKIRRRKAEKGYFLSINPKNFVFRRATAGRPYGVYEKPGFSTV